jgi:hypothetical protein
MVPRRKAAITRSWPLPSAEAQITFRRIRASTMLRTPKLAVVKSSQPIPGSLRAGMENPRPFR